MNLISPHFIIADTHDVFRYGLLNLLKQNFTGCTITQVADGGSLLQSVQQQPYDVILIAANLPPVDGFDAARQLVQLNAEYRIIMYEYEHSEDVVVEAFASGATAFFYRDETQHTIIFKVTEMLKNGCCITRDTVTAYRAAQQRLTAAKNNTKQLTLREKEVLQYIIKGLTNRQIASLLHRSVKTIANHRYNIMLKAGRHNTAQLLAHARETGWV